MPLLKQSDMIAQCAKALRKKHSVLARHLDIELFHLSFDGELSGLWQLQTPAGLRPEGQSEHPEPQTPRISLAPSVEQCFRAIYPNISRFFEEDAYPHIDMWVYKPEFEGHERVVTPQELTKLQFVWDAHVTDEHWALTPTQMRVFERVRFYNTEPTGTRKTAPFGKTKAHFERSVGPEDIRFEWLGLPADHRSIRYATPRSLSW